VERDTTAGLSDLSGSTAAAESTGGQAASDAQDQAGTPAAASSAARDPDTGGRNSGLSANNDATEGTGKNPTEDDQDGYPDKAVGKP
jgi:ribosomal protein S11